MQFRVLRLGALTLAVGALLTLPGAVAEAAFPGTNGLIAFERGANIYTVTTDGAHTVSSSPLVTNGSEPAWSPDGTKLAYVEAGTSSIKVLTIGGATSGALDTGTSPTWSPDGTMIAYEKGSDIFVVSSGGGTARNLSNSGAGADDDDPAWSPDGDHIAFTRTVAGNADIYTMDAPADPSAGGGGGGNQQALTTAGSNEIQPNYSPGGTRIAYSSNRHGLGQIYSIATSGGTETRITSSSTDDTHPAYSPDGVRLAFARAGSGIHTTDTQITSGVTAVNDTNPDWQPAAPTNTTLPVITGNASEGGTLFASTGTFAGSASSFAYQWLRCDSEGNNCADIASATGSSYVVVADDVGTRLRVRVTASGSSGSSSATSDPTVVIAGPEPRNVTPPRVVVFGSTGVPVVGVTLSSSAGTWTGSGFLTFRYQWKKCMPKEGPCYRILTPAAMSSIFVPTADLIGWYLRVEVTATNSAGSKTEQSESTPAVISNPPVNTVRPRVSVFAVPPTVGQLLTVDTGTWSGLFPFTYTYEWRRCDPPGTLPSCKPIPGAVASTYAVTEADLGLTLRVWVTANSPGGSGTAITDHTFPAIPAPRLGPSMTVAPAISGEAKLGGRLTGTRGTWTGFAPIRYVSVWQRCDATLTVCKAVKSVKRLSYPVTAADLGYRIRLSVVAANPIGSIRARSEATEPIILSPPKPKGRRIVGSNRPDYIPGGGGDDQLFGRGGADTIVGGAGDDRLDGGLGNDYLDAGKGADRVSAGPGSDTVLAADGEVDRISCGAGNDRVIADAGDVVDPDCEAVTRGSSTPPPEDDDDGDDRP
jgi:Tol biopolymer transport system component